MLVIHCLSISPTEFICHWQENIHWQAMQMFSIWTKMNGAQVYVAKLVIQKAPPSICYWLADGRTLLPFFGGNHSLVIRLSSNHYPHCTNFQFVKMNGSHPFLTLLDSQHAHSLHYV